MPIYEYHCTACNADFEKLVFGPSPSVVCEKCGSTKTEKLMSRFGMGRAQGASSPGDSSGSSGCGGCSSSSCAGCH
ncbi:MAG: zinc ribbon domain-containing protein [Nitrospiraceae bacterium]|nr:zinc ribbon domain-containing protein [Nitrospiraceae bacterium]